MHISLGFSTCPNDTFMFDAMVHQRIPLEGLSFEPQLADILHLNQRALAGELDMVKISYHTYGQVQDQYHLLDAGSALGHQCGPLLISKAPISVADLIANELPVAIPGHNTTANLLLHYLAPDIQQKREMVFHEIMPAILRGEVAAGVIIHENRFTYQDLGLRLIQDLGEHWEKQTQLPIPLGAIVAKKSLGQARIQQLEKLMRASVQYAFDHPEVSHPYVSAHAQEMDKSVMQAHIELYVNDYSISLGVKGKAAVEKLLEIGSAMKQQTSPSSNH